MINCLDRSANGSRCQPPAPGARCEQLELLLAELYADPYPPRALVNRMVDALRHFDARGRQAEAMQVLTSARLGIIERTHALAEALPGHDPLDADVAFAQTIEPLDELVALGMLLRQSKHGWALNGLVNLLVTDLSDAWRETHRRHAEDAATLLLMDLRAPRDERQRRELELAHAR